MAEPKGTAFICVKYVLITLWVFQLIGLIMIIIGGSVMVAASHVQMDDQSKEYEEARQVTRIFGYVIMAVAAIGLPISIIAIYGIYKEIYKINFWITVLSVIGFVFVLFSGSAIQVIVIEAIVLLIQVYFTYKVKHSDNYSNEDNNAELGKIKPNENTAIIMTAYQQ